MRVIERDVEKIAYCETLMKKCADLHLAAPTLLTYGIDHFDKEGNQLLKETAKSNSFVRNYYNYIAQYALAWYSTGNYGEGSLSFKNELGALCNISTESKPGGVMPGAYGEYCHRVDTAFFPNTISTVSGVVVGLTADAESFESHKLSNKITHGTGPNQLSYGVAAPPSQNFNSTTKKYTNTYARTFVNNSSSSVIINEIGFMGNCGISYISYPFLFVRDVPASPLTLLPGESAIVSYAFSYIMSN